MKKILVSCRKGFTLIELLVSISIIAILIGIGLVSIRGIRAVARDGQRKTELEEIRSALEVYRTDEGSYPSANGPAHEVLTNLEPDYLDPVPEDPLPDYFYQYQSNDGLTYVLCAHLETKTGSFVECGDDCGDTCNYKVENP
jgi:general secretion pathway protein G